jgi:hypothetical protein
MVEAKKILEDLYTRYYQVDQHSAVTSSWWRSIGSHAVERAGDRFEVHGFGFGVFADKNIKNRLKMSVSTYLSRRLLKDFGCDPSVKRAALEIADEMGRIFCFDCAKQALSLTWIKRALGERFGQLKTVSVIGDGYAFMGALVKRVLPAVSVLSVNLGRTLFFDVFYTSRISKDYVLSLLVPEKASLVKRAYNFLEAERFDLLAQQPIDLFVNIASMQEIDPPITQRYFEFMRQSGSEPVYFYCCNRESKQLPDGTITEFEKYPWGEAMSIFDERCPWYQKYPIGRPPFWILPDGPVRHRLAQLK